MDLEDIHHDVQVSLRRVGVSDILIFLECSENLTGPTHKDRSRAGVLSGVDVLAGEWSFLILFFFFAADCLVVSVILAPFYIVADALGLMTFGEDLTSIVVWRRGSTWNADAGLV